MQAMKTSENTPVKKLAGGGSSRVFCHSGGTAPRLLEQSRHLTECPYSFTQEIGLKPKRVKQRVKRLVRILPTVRFEPQFLRATQEASSSRNTGAVLKLVGDRKGSENTPANQLAAGGSSRASCHSGGTAPRLLEQSRHLTERIVQIGDRKPNRAMPVAGANCTRANTGTAIAERRIVAVGAVAELPLAKYEVSIFSSTRNRR